MNQTNTNQVGDLPQGLAIASMVTGILSLLGCSMFAAIPAIVCGHIGVRQADRGEASGRGMAMAGLIMGYISLVVTVIIIAIYAAFFILFATAGVSAVSMGNNGARLAAERMSRMNNTKMVAIALHDYHAAYKQLPPTFTVDDEGEVLSTWRIAIEPFMDSGIPTDGELTLETAGGIAPIPFQTVPVTDAADTDLYVIVAENGMFSPNPNAGNKFRSVLDGLANTLMAIKIPGRPVDWRSTNQLTPDEAFAAIQSVDKSKPINLLMGDGAVEQVTEPFDRATFDALLSRDGGETVDMSFLSF